MDVLYIFFELICCRCLDRFWLQLCLVQLRKRTFNLLFLHYHHCCYIPWLGCEFKVMWRYILGEVWVQLARKSLHYHLLGKCEILIHAQLQKFLMCDESPAYCLKNLNLVSITQWFDSEHGFNLFIFFLLFEVEHELDSLSRVHKLIFFALFVSRCSKLILFSFLSGFILRLAIRLFCLIKQSP